MHASNSSGIPLTTGDPAADAPASFTRFALPFIWSLSDDAPSGASHVFRRAAIPRIQERRRYFTPETASALFGRACWFDLEENPGHAAANRVSGELVLHVGKRDVTILVARPRIVLFEASSPKTTAEIAKTGFLLLDVSFPKSETNAPTLDDLMIVNELFRYWRSPYPDHKDDPRSTADGDSFCYASVMKESIEGKDPYLTRWDRLLTFPVETDQGMRRLVAREAHQEVGAWIESASGKRGWIAATDERAFVWTCALTPSGARDLSGIRRSRDPKFAGEWVRLLNVDLPSLAEATEFEREWVMGRTYERWKHLRTLYGFSMHSGAMLAEPCLKPPLWRHFGELYFDQILLLLYVRVSLFRFSEALAEITKDLAAPGKKDFAEFRELRRSFVFLTNLYRFPLLSSQQQGIEIYTEARKGLDVDELFGEVQTQIETTHEMFELISTSKMAQVTADLTYAVLGAGVLATLMAFLAAEDLSTSPREPVLHLLDQLPWLMPSWWLILFSIPAILLLWLLALWRQRR